MAKTRTAQIDKFGDEGLEWLAPPNTELAYRPGQARVPKGQHTGGRWTSGTATGAGETFFASPSDAIFSLEQGKPVTIAREDLHNVLMRAKDSPVNDIDLTKLTIEDTALFAGGLNRPRLTMPQIPKEHRTEFISDIKSQGVHVLQESVSPLSLLPTQNEINAGRVGAKLAQFEQGNKLITSIFVSRDDYVLDGHHRWAVAASVAFTSPEARVRQPVTRIMVDRDKALGLMEEFMKKHNIPKEGLEFSSLRHLDISDMWELAYNPSQPRVPKGASGGGRWTSAGGGALQGRLPLATLEQMTPEERRFAELQAKHDELNFLPQAEVEERDKLVDKIGHTRANEINDAMDDEKRRKMAKPEPADEFHVASDAHISTGTVTGNEVMDTGSANEVRRVTLEHEGRTADAIFKPESGERWDDNFSGSGGGSDDWSGGGGTNPIRETVYHNQDFTLAQREAAAYEVSKVLGLNNVPPTVYRNIGSEPGMVQQFVHGASVYAEGGGGSAQDHLNMAVLDIVIGNTDRHGYNGLVDADGKMWAIDHGYSFPSGHSEFRQEIVDVGLVRRYAGEMSAHTDAIKHNLDTFGWDAFARKHGMDANERAALKARVKTLSDHLTNGAVGVADAMNQLRIDRIDIGGSSGGSSGSSGSN